jgi:hypothetical protein
MAWKAGLLSDTYSMAAVDSTVAVRYRLHQRLVLVARRMPGFSKEGQAAKQSIWLLDQAQ